MLYGGINNRYFLEIIYIIDSRFILAKSVTNRGSFVILFDQLVLYLDSYKSTHGEI